MEISGQMIPQSIHATISIAVAISDPPCVLKIEQGLIDIGLRFAVKVLVRSDCQVNFTDVLYIETLRADMAVKRGNIYRTLMVMHRK